jgi:hypothetical protein
MMQVLACYTGMDVRTQLALAGHAPAADIVCTGDAGTEYWRQISSRRNGRDDLVIIEQDVQITADVLPSFAACPEPWGPEPSWDNDDDEAMRKLLLRPAFTKVSSFRGRALDRCRRYLQKLGFI